MNNFPCGDFQHGFSIIFTSGPVRPNVMSPVSSRFSVSLRDAVVRFDFSRSVKYIIFNFVHHLWKARKGSNLYVRSSVIFTCVCFERFLVI